MSIMEANMIVSQMMVLNFIRSFVLSVDIFINTVKFENSK